MADDRVVTGLPSSVVSGLSLYERGNVYNEDSMNLVIIGAGKPFSKSDTSRTFDNTPAPCLWDHLYLRADPLLKRGNMGYNPDKFAILL